MAPTTPASLAHKHFQLSLRNGFVLLVPAAALGTLLFFCYLASEGTDASVTARAAAVAGGWVSYTANTLFFGALFIGVPALVFGALRTWPMRWLLRLCLTEPTNPNVALGLVGTLLLFEGPLLLAALFGASNQSLWFGALASLPFLLGSLWATWQVLRAEQQALALEQTV